MQGLGFTGFRGSNDAEEKNTWNMKGKPGGV